MKDSATTQDALENLSLGTHFRRKRRRISPLAICLAIGFFILLFAGFWKVAIPVGAFSIWLGWPRRISMDEI